MNPRLNARQRRDEAHARGRHVTTPDLDCFGCAAEAKARLAGLVTMAAKVTDDTVVGLMVRMSKNGQAATRKGDAYGILQFQTAWDIYHAEARKRGLVTS
jgi:hypothetical protein